MWKGRFNKETAGDLTEFTESISFDNRLYKYDIQGSLAHAKALRKSDILTQDELDKISSGLKKILKDIKSDNFLFSKKLEDIHMNIESELINDIGEVGAKIHTARSRNDQISLDMRLYCKDELKKITKLIETFQKSLIEFSKKNKEVIIPGYTHLQRAQPVYLAHHLLAYVEMLERDKSRIKDCFQRLDVMPLGSGALAGSTINLDRNFIAEELGFKKISTNSMDAISDRDFIAEIIFVTSLIQVHLSRLSEDVILWASTEFNFIEISDMYTTGSSLMPQKKNPDIVELIRGKSARMIGNTVNILTLIKGLPMTYNRDFQEDKMPLFDSIDIVSTSLGIFTSMLNECKINKESCSNAIQDEFLLATDLADYLVLKGEPFRNAHNIIGKVTSYCIQNKTDFSELDISVWKKFSEKFNKDIKDYINVNHSLECRKNVGSPSLKQISIQIKKWENCFS